MNWRKSPALTSIVLLILGWKLVQLVISAMTIDWLPFTPTFPYALELLPKYGPRLLTTWANFDGVHYLTIIERGYFGTGLIQAFFPLYPLLVKFLSLDGVINPLIIGISFSLVLLGAGFYLWLLSDFVKHHAWASRLVLFLLVFPTSYYLGSLYTEALFVFLVIFVWYALEQKKLYWITAAGISAGLTRLTGVFLIVPIGFYLWQQDHLTSWKSKLALVSPLIGLGIYMAYLGWRFGDPFLFYSVQDDFGAARATDSLILLPQVVFRYMKMLNSVPVMTVTYWAIAQELALSLFGIIGLWFSYRRIPSGWWWFCLLSFMLPTLTGTFSSMPRYILTSFPLFLGVLAVLSDRHYYWFLVLLAIMQVVNIILFTQGIWVA